MAVFNIDPRFNGLIKAIERSRNINGDQKRYFVNYINGIKQGARNNDFLEDELLEKVILEVLNYQGYGNGKYTPQTYFEKLIVRSKIVFPFGTNTENYELLKELFISCINTDTELFNDGLFAIFNNKKDYVDIINFLRSDEQLIANAPKITQYGMDVAVDCQTQDMLKREIIAFATNTLRTDDVDDLAKRYLLEAKKRNGAYDVDEKSLSLAAAQFEKAKGLVQRLDDLKIVVDNHCNRVKTMTEAGKQDLIDARKDVIDGLKNYEMGIENTINRRVDGAMANAEDEFKVKGEKILSELMSDAAAKINEMQIVATGIATSLSGDMVRMQKAKEEMQKAKDDAISRVQEYIDNESKLQELIDNSRDTKELREILVQLKEKQATQSDQNISSNETSKVIANPTIAAPKIYIPAINQYVSPYDEEVIIPTDHIDYTILPAFDRSIPFEKRMDAVLKRMKQLQAQGEKFHSMTEEIVRCIMSGDFVYLWGPSGSGKSFAIRQVALILGMDRLSTKMRDKYSVLAYNDAHGVFHATNTFIALLYGKMIDYEELDNDNPDIHVTLNGIYSGLVDKLRRPNEKVMVNFADTTFAPVHPNFRMAATGNTCGQGEDVLYSARNKVDESVQQRWIPKEMTYDSRLENELLKDCPAWADLFKKFRQVCEKYAKTKGMGYAQGILTTRDADFIAQYVNDNSKSVEQLLREKFIQVKDDDYLRYIIENIKKLYEGAGSSMNCDSPINHRELSKYSSQELGRMLVYTSKKCLDNGTR